MLNKKNYTTHDRNILFVFIGLVVFITLISIINNYMNSESRIIAKKASNYGYKVEDKSDYLQYYEEYYQELLDLDKDKRVSNEVINKGLIEVIESFIYNDNDNFDMAHAKLLAYINYLERYDFTDKKQYDLVIEMRDNLNDKHLDNYLVRVEEIIKKDNEEVVTAAIESVREKEMNKDINSKSNQLKIKIDKIERQYTDGEMTNDEFIKQLDIVRTEVQTERDKYLPGKETQNVLFAQLFLSLMNRIDVLKELPNANSQSEYNDILSRSIFYIRTWKDTMNELNFEIGLD